MLEFLKLVLGLTPEREYLEGRTGYYKRWGTSASYSATTPAGFNVTFHVSGGLLRVDDAAFKAAQMLEDKAKEDTFNAFCQRTIGTAFARGSFFALVLIR